MKFSGGFKNKIAVILLIFLVGFFVFYLFSGRISKDQRRNDRQIEEAEYIINLEEIEADLIQEISESPHDIYIDFYDFAVDEKISINAHRPLYPASLIKVLFMLTAFEQVSEGRLDLNETYTLKESDKYVKDTFVSGTGILQFEETGNIYTLEELIELMISKSDNIAANMVMDIVGIEEINSHAQKLGLDDTKVYRKMYEIESDKPSNTSTAGDLNRMLEYFEKRQGIEESLYIIGREMMYETEGKKRIAYYIDDEYQVANKTGTVDSMLGDMALIYFSDRPPVALTIMVRSPLEYEKAREEISRLSRLIFDALPHT